MRWILALLFGFASAQLARAADIDALYRALEASDTPAVQRFVAERYGGAGISLNDRLVWESQRFDEIVNWYNQNTEVILLSDLPRADEMARYWDNWSEVLTQGRWSWRDFFVDDAEAALMANFNQFFVAAHEYGHALTYRYDPKHEERTGNSVNCREYFADRLAAGLLEELAAEDTRIAALRQRYRALIDTINALIEVTERYQTPTLAALEADCRILDVAQPEEDSMTPYVSAFFVRHGLLLAADLPPLAEMYTRYLLPHLKERQFPSAGISGPVRTGAPIARIPATELVDLPYEYQVFSFAPDGTLFEIQSLVDSDAEPPRIAFRYGLAGTALQIVIPPTDLPGLTLGEFIRLLPVSSATALGPEHFVALSGGGGAGGSPIVAFDVRRSDGKWQLQVIDLVPDFALAQNIGAVGIVSDPAGRASAWLLEPAADGAPSRWRGMTLDPKTMAPVATTTIPAPNLSGPVALLASGEALFSDSYRVLAVDEKGMVRTIAGNGLQGFKDNADPLEAEFVLSGMPVHTRADGGFDTIDYDIVRRSYVFRHIAPAQ